MSFFGKILQPFVFVIEKIMNFFILILGNNYGLAIIATTVFIKLVTLPLGLKQEHSMYVNSKIQPKLQEIKEKYKNDKEKQAQELQKLYAEENANPAAGCLPMLIQLPIFIAMYTVVRKLGTGENSHFLWFTLSQPDQLFKIYGFTFNLLPIISAVLQLAQQKLMMMRQTKSADETENSVQKSMMFMPLIMLFIFYNMPSGLNLYYAVFTFLSLLQSFVYMKYRQHLNEKENIKG